MKDSKLLFSVLMLGSILTISGYSVPNLQYHTQVHKAGHPEPKKAAVISKKEDSAKQAAVISKKEDSKSTAVQKDLKNPMNIQDGSAEEFP